MIPYSVVQWEIRSLLAKAPEDIERAGKSVRPVPVRRSYIYRQKKVHRDVGIRVVGFHIINQRIILFICFHFLYIK